MRRYELSPTKASCPVCSSEDAQLLYCVTSEEAAQHFIRKEGSEKKFLALRACIEQLWQAAECQVVRCTHCGFGFSNPFVAGDHQYYSLIYSDSIYPSYRWEFQVTQEALKATAPQFKILEVGAGDGSFIKRIAPELTSKENALCLEYSDYGKQKINEYGVRCLAEDVRTLDRAECREGFDVVCMFQVLEHMDNLDSLFEQLTRITSPNANLFISVPNPKAVEFSELNGGLLDMPPHHIGRWEPSCFAHIGQRFGWNVVRYEIEQKSYTSQIKKFIRYRYWRQTQNPNTLANYSQRAGNQQLRKFLKLAAGAQCALDTLPVLNALRSKELGGAQWIHLKKSNTY